MIKKYLLYHKSKTLKKEKKKKEGRRGLSFSDPFSATGSPLKLMCTSPPLLPPSHPKKILNCQNISKQYMF